MPDNVSIQGLQFEISTKTSDSKMTRGISTFKNAITKMGTESDKTANKLQNLSNALNNMKGINNVKWLTENLAKLQEVKVSPAIANNLNKIGEALDNLSEASIARVERLADSLRGLQGTNFNFNLNANGADSVQADVAQAVEPNVDTAQMQEFASMETQVSNGLTGLSNSAGRAGSALSGFLSVLRGLKTVGSGAASAIYSINRAFAKLAIFSGSKLASGVKAFTSALGKISWHPSRAITDLTSKFSGLFSSMKRIAMYRMIRTFMRLLSQSIREGISNLYQYSAAMGGTFKNSMDSLATSFLYLKNSMGAMVSPLINALAPAVEYVIDKFVGLLNIVNQFFAALTGKKTTTVAKRVATTFKEASDSAGNTANGVSNAAKELKRSILGFDEINALNAPDKGSGGSGGGSGSGGASTPSYADMFETIEVDSGISDWVEDLKKAFDEGDWKTLGTMLGDKFNELVDYIPWDDFGEKVGKTLSGVISTAYYFFEEADFRNLGNNIATFINNAIEKMLEDSGDGTSSFYKLGALVVAPFESLADIMIGAIEDIDAESVGIAFHDFFTGLFDDLTKWLEKYDWEDLGDIAYTKIKDFFGGLDAGDIVSSITTFLGTALRSVGEFLVGLGKDLVDDFVTAWTDRFKEKSKDYNDNPILTFIGTLGSFGNDAKDWVVEHIINPFVSALTGEENWKFPGLEKIASDYWRRIKESWGNVGDWVTENIITPFTDALSGFSLSGLSVKVSDVIKPEDLLDGISKGFGNVKSWVSDNLIDPIVDAFGNMSNWKLPDFAELGSSLWGKVKKSVSEAFGNVKEFFSGLFNFKVDLSEFGIDLKNSDIVVKLKGDVTSSFSNLKEKWDSISTKTANVKKTITGAIGKGWNDIKSKWASITSGNAKKTIQGAIGSGWARVKEAWNSIKTKAVSLSAKVTGGASGIVDKIKQKWEWLKNHATITIKAKFLDKAYAGIRSAWNSFASKYNSFRSNVNSKLSILHLSLPGPLNYMARGGIANDPTSAIIGEAGKEAVLPLERNLGWQRTLAEQLVAKMGGMNTQSDNSDMIYHETVRQNELLAQQNRLLTQILEKDVDVKISTTSIQEGLARKNLRDGKTTVPVY